MLSPITPMMRNTDFLPGMTDNGFSLWENAGIKTLKDLFEGDRMMSFDQLRLKYNLPRTHFFSKSEVLFRIELGVYLIWKCYQLKIYFATSSSDITSTFIPNGPEEVGYVCQMQ